MCNIQKNIPGLKVLIFKDGDEYVAHILDLDLVGTGATKDEAMKAVCDAAGSQIAYAMEHSSVDNIFKPAPKSFYEKWEEIGQRAIMKILITGKIKAPARNNSRYEAYELPVQALCPELA